MTGRFPPPSVSRPALLDPDGSDSAFRRTIYDLLTVGMRVQEVRDRLAAEMGVTGPQYAILMAIAHLENESEGAGIRSVAQRLHVSGPFITAQVNLLVDAGMVEKLPDPNDGRAVRLSLGRQGRAAIERTSAAIQAANDAFFAPLAKDDFAALGALAARLVESSETALRQFDAGAREAAS